MSASASPRFRFPSEAESAPFSDLPGILPTRVEPGVIITAWDSMPPGTRGIGEAATAPAPDGAVVGTDPTMPTAGEPSLAAMQEETPPPSEPAAAAPLGATVSGTATTACDPAEDAPNSAPAAAEDAPGTTSDAAEDPTSRATDPAEDDTTTPPDAAEDVAVMPADAASDTPAEAPAGTEGATAELRHAGDHAPESAGATPPAANPSPSDAGPLTETSGSPGTSWAEEPRWTFDWSVPDLGAPPGDLGEPPPEDGPEPAPDPLPPAPPLPDLDALRAEMAELAAGLAALRKFLASLPPPPPWADPGLTLPTVPDLPDLGDLFAGLASADLPLL